MEETIIIYKFYNPAFYNYTGICPKCLKMNIVTN